MRKKDYYKEPESLYLYDLYGNNVFKTDGYIMSETKNGFLNKL